MLSDGHQLAQVRVEPRPRARAAEGLLVHVRRAGGHHHSFQAQLADVVLDHVLAQARAHERVVSTDHDALLGELLAGVVAHIGDIDRAGDVAAAVADVYAGARRVHRATCAGCEGCAICSGKGSGMGKPVGRFWRRGSWPPSTAGSAGGATSTRMRASARAAETTSLPMPSCSGGRPKARPMSWVKNRIGMW